MSRGDGFANADVDTGYFRDLKVRKLARLYPELFPVAVSGYFGILLGSWGCGERLTAADGWPENLPWSAEAVAALQDVKLLDRLTRISPHAWEGWYGVAFARREAAREAGARGGHRKALNRLAALQASSSPAVGSLEGSSSLALPVPTVPTVPTDSPQPPARRGARDRSRRDDGTNPRATGRNLRELRDGSPETDRRTLTSLSEELAKRGFTAGGER